jgi:hypothetical protein
MAHMIGVKLSTLNSNCSISAISYHTYNYNKLYHIACYRTGSMIFRFPDGPKWLASGVTGIALPMGMGCEGVDCMYPRGDGGQTEGLGAEDIDILQDLFPNVKDHSARAYLNTILIAGPHIWLTHTFTSTYTVIGRRKMLYKSVIFFQAATIHFPFCSSSNSPTNSLIASVVSTKCSYVIWCPLALARECAVRTAFLI